MGHIDQLGDDMTKSILSTLQLELLIKCKCVSKRWKDLVTEIIKEKKEKMKGVILVNFVHTDLPGMYIPQYSYASPHANVYNLDLAMDYLPFRHFTVRDSCNGNLLCIGGNEPGGSYYICNPVTRKWVVLPDSPPTTPNQHDVLAFDPSSPHYKVLRWFQPNSPRYQFAELDVYSSRTRTWSRIGIPNLRRINTYPRDDMWTSSVFIKGVVFILADPNVVVALLVSEDVFPPSPVIKLPYQDLDETIHRRLGKWGGLLCYMDYNKTRIKIWVLEDLSRRKWVLKQVISVQTLLNLIPEASRIDHPFLPVAFHAEKEEIILEVPEGVVCYGLTTSKFVGMYSINYLQRGNIPFRDVTVYPFSASFHCP
ncbi:F-box protein At5g18160-like [Aristolochia californica]|uniref:F-box protein At5g18160-like n=1 Tax=Aristolochia californica TaxID=171875 RepID=UPI0035DEBA78